MCFTGDLHKEQSNWHENWKIRLDELKRDKARLSKRVKELTQENVKVVCLSCIQYIKFIMNSSETFR